MPWYKLTEFLCKALFQYMIADSGLISRPLRSWRWPPMASSDCSGSRTRFEQITAIWVELNKLLEAVNNISTSQIINLRQLEDIKATWGCLRLFEAAWGHLGGIFTFKVAVVQFNSNFVQCTKTINDCRLWSDLEATWGHGGCLRTTMAFWGHLGCYL